MHAQVREAGQLPAAEAGLPSKDSQLAKAEVLLTEGQLSAAAALVRSVVGGRPLCLVLSPVQECAPLWQRASASSFCSELSHGPRAQAAAVASALQCQPALQRGGQRVNSLRLVQVLQQRQPPWTGSRRLRPGLLPSRL